MTARKRPVRIADIVGSRIRDSEGKTIGHVVDVAATEGPPYRPTELLSGGWEWLDRLEVLRVFGRHLRGHPQVTHIPWDDVDSFDGYTVKLKKPRPD